MADELIFTSNSEPEELAVETKGLDSLSEETQKLVREYEAALSSPADEGAAIQVDEIASKVASFYEKIRGIIDWKEEHLIRRTAIERILKRRMISEISGFSLVADLKAKDIAEPLVLELIRGGHYPNNQIPQKRLSAVEKSLNKYIFILSNSPLARNGSPAGLKRKVNFYHWILEIAACEIEEILGPPLKQNALIEYMTNWMVKKIQVNPESAITDEEKKLQTYIAVQRSLFQLDTPIISYHLILLKVPQWSDLPESSFPEVAQNILKLASEIEKDLSHPLASDFFRLCEQYDTPYLILGDILKNLSDRPQIIRQALSSSEHLEELTEEAYGKRLSTLKSRLFRMAIWSTLSIFITSAFSLFVVEVPLAKLFYGRFNILAMVVDVMLPTALMFLLVSLIKPPRSSNLPRVISEVKKLVYPQTKIDAYQIKAVKTKGVFLKTITGLLFLVGTFSSLGLVFWIFYIARIPITSVYIDTLNVALVVFAALIIRERAKELVVEEKLSFWEFILDAMFVPLAKVGQWLATKWKEYNIVNVFFTVLIDMPFQALVQVIENWSLFIKEKKAGIR